MSEVATSINISPYDLLEAGFRRDFATEGDVMRNGRIRGFVAFYAKTYEVRGEKFKVSCTHHCPIEPWKKRHYFHFSMKVNGQKWGYRVYSHQDEETLEDVIAYFASKVK